MKCILVLSLAKNVAELQGDLIGVDRGAYILAVNNKKMIMAIGDFDSVNKTEYEIIKNYTTNIINLNVVKDDTDTLAALKQVIALGYDEIEVFGGLSKRLDHTFANLLLLQKYKQIICLKDENTLVKLLTKGEYNIVERYQYISFFAIEDSVITLKNLKYNLDKYKINKIDIIGISNEFINKLPFVKVFSGQVMMILSNE